MKIRSTKRKRTSFAVGALAALAAVAGTFAAPSVAHADETNPNHLTVVYDAVGSTHVAGGVNADMAIGPTDIKVTIDTMAPLPTPIVAGSMSIPSKVMNFEILGLPARSRVTMTQVGEITGTLTKLPSPRQALELKSTVKYDVKLSDVEVKVFGIWWPLAVGNNCHTINPATINVSSPIDNSTTPPTGYFTINGGGPLTSKYTIGNFTGCAPLNFFSIPGFFPTIGSIPINAIVPNSDNTLQLNLSNPRQP
ncbi:hypothetical protein GUY44_20715 [Pimelobacter simplex]|uniref:Uncharacterized protein n=1 Tax=Nocardioides simplex TaxID=2045 RepID=A0A0A1DIN6_NOCSI|nr:hypothetical protein [Pimelobacter simplex]AIY16413.1 hypothetical protein KR76_05910 [Pimelobacter simplex]MCG8152917.1 hypothetical protein [Pimelobacter simplex]GEB11885.1 hypothetical protein NSI01_02000 [Pimelobacter simplex]SFN03032.1 hypothetical protein SAMN05421671_4745 [Pimelobacter simplex]